MQEMVKEIHSHEWWLPYIEEWRSRNISMRGYCIEKGFSYDAFGWHWRIEKKKVIKNSETEVLPVVVNGTCSSQKQIEINGIEVCGSTDDLRDLLGIRL